MRVTLAKIQPETNDVTTFHLLPEKPFRYIAGQFVELYLPHENPDDRGEKRWFTLSSPPSSSYISITTQHSSEASSSFKQALFSLKAGDDLTLSSPMGDFILPKNKAVPLVFVAGGIGCTPFHSMISELQNNSESRDITMLYAVKTHADLAFLETFQQLGDKFVPITRRLKVQDILQKASNDNSYIFLSGPEPMIENLNDVLIAANITKRRIHTDFFPGYKNAL